MNAPLVKVGIPSLMMDEAELMKVLSTSLYPGAQPESIKLVIGWCKAQNKDPMKRPVHIVPMQVKVPVVDRDGNIDINKKKTVWRDVLMPGIGDYRTDAARTGEYAGIGEAVYGPDISKELGGEDKTEWNEQARAKVKSGSKYETLPFKYPEWCQISVFRMVQGVRCEFSSGKVYFLETYATAGNETSLPNAMWKKRPRGQLEKCAEAMALRRAFPEVGANPTADEMEGKVIDDGAVINNETGHIEHPKIAQPQSKSASPPQAPATAKTGAADTAPAGKAPDGDVGSAPIAQQKEADTRPMAEGQKNVLRAKLANAGLNDIDLFAKFGRKLGTKGSDVTPEMEGWLFPHFNEVTEWIATKSGQS